MNEPPRPRPLTCITQLAPEICISLHRWPNKTLLQDFLASELRCKVPTANIIVARVEDTMDVLLGRHLFEHLILPLEEQIFVDKLIPKCLPSKTSSLAFVQIWRWLPYFKKTPNILQRLSSLHLGFLELYSPNCYFL